MGLTSLPISKCHASGATDATEYERANQCSVVEHEHASKGER
jgi:hypothetical protein